MAMKAAHELQRLVAGIIPVIESAQGPISDCYYAGEQLSPRLVNSLIKHMFLPMLQTAMGRVLGGVHSLLRSAKQKARIGRHFSLSSLCA